MEGLAEPRHLASGTMLDDKYRIDDLLAVGGMGAVYVGTHIKLRKRVAIKVLNPGLSNPQMIERFHREAITASAIGHEGIAQVTDIGTSSDGEPFLVMELLEGESLGRRMKVSGALPIEVACELACSILSPLGAAHRAGIIHRDLKPDNVFLVRQSRGEMVKLLDFGISRTEGLDGEFRLTTTGLVLGTPYYMSPEQARGDAQITPQTDLYALGVMLYEMLVGTVPITGENYNQLMYHVMSGTFVPPRQVRPEIPVELEALIHRAMAQQSAERPRSAEEFEQQLLPFCRPNFREHTIERTSSQGFSPVLSPTPSLHLTPMAYSAQRSGYGSDPTVLAASTQSSAPPRSKRGLVIGLVAMFAVAGGIAAFVMMTGGSPVALAPAPVVVATPSTVDVTPPTPTTPTTPPTPPTPPTPVKRPVTPAPPVTSTVHEPANGEAIEVVDPTIVLKFEITPANANPLISIDGKPGALEQKMPMDGVPHKIHVVADGYKAFDDVLHFTIDQTEPVALEKLPPKPVKGSHGDIKKPGSRIESKSPY